MTKALASFCWILLICAGGSAWADKPKLAVLGLEVTPGPGGAVDPATTQIAKEVTKELRLRAQTGSSPYLIAPNSNKELTDEKLLLSCDNEAKDCMAVIGAGLAADMLLFGRVERRGELYKVSLKLLDVKTKALEQRTDEMPVGASPAGVSKRLYNKLIGDAPGSTGSVVVVARNEGGSGVPGGKVMIDDERVGELADGKLSVSGVSEGAHVVAIEAGGFRRFEETVTVRSGQPSKVNAVLVDRSATSLSGSGSASDSRSHALLWKVALVSSIAVAAAGGGFALYSYKQTTNVKGYKVESGTDPNTMMPYVVTDPPGSDDCGKSDVEIQNAKHAVVNPAFRSSCKWNARIVPGFIVMGVGVVGAVVSAIMLTRDTGPEKSTASRARRSSLAIVPVVTPDQAGASLSFRW